MRRLLSRFSRWHLWSAVVIWLIFTLLTLWTVSQGLYNAGDRPGTVALTTLGTVLGPMTGAISRDFQGCCLRFSLSLMPYCAASLAIGIAAQLWLPPGRKWLRPIRATAWIGGLLVWFGGGILSFLHALS